MLCLSKSFKRLPFLIVFGVAETLKLLVYEHVSGGGFADKPLASSILSEGFGMLRTVISDFKAAGHSVTTVLDSRLAVLNPPIKADCTVPVSSSREAEVALQRISESADAAYLIAPESNQALQSLVASIEKAGVLSLNCRAGAIGKVSDKVALYEHVKKLGLPTPESVVVSAVKDVAEIKQVIGGRLGFPLIFKPVDGAGCGGLSVVRNESQIGGAAGRVIRESSSKHFIAQELVRGVDVSVSLISTGTETVPISLNRQDVSLAPPDSISNYQGGLVPFDSSLRREAFAMAKQIVKSFKGLRGYVGVDLVLTEEKPVVIEVNPRLTASYIGMRKVVDFNVAQAIIDSVLEYKLPRNNESGGYAFFSKVETPKPTIEALQKTYRMREVVSPPFPVSDADTAHALVLSHRATLKAAMSGFHEAKKRLLNSIIRGK
jgi:predicted ATP-grasp superfamily ATP-dependent carboligase